MSSEEICLLGRPGWLSSIVWRFEQPMALRFNHSQQCNVHKEDTGILECENARTWKWEPPKWYSSLPETAPLTTILGFILDLYLRLSIFVFSHPTHSSLICSIILPKPFLMPGTILNNGNTKSSLHSHSVFSFWK